ncbi:MAG TPA: hypothetical protein DCY79_00685 [Planctomycetaceae bacterium]|nr:hypothetical protein [Planctomycetaceae bacterium]
MPYVGHENQIVSANASCVSSTAMPQRTEMVGEVNYPSLIVVGVEICLKRIAPEGFQDRK